MKKRNSQFKKNIIKLLQNIKCMHLFLVIFLSCLYRKLYYKLSKFFIKNNYNTLTEVFFKYSNLEKDKHTKPQIFCLHAKRTVVYGRKVNNPCSADISRFFLFFSQKLQNMCFVKKKGVFSLTVIKV